MAIRTVQKKGGLKSMKNDNEKEPIQKNDVYLKTNERLFNRKTKLKMISIVSFLVIMFFIGSLSVLFENDLIYCISMLILTITILISLIFINRRKNETKT